MVKENLNMKTQSLETEIHELQSQNMILNAKLREREEELKKFWEDKERITWSEEEIRKEREKMEKKNKSLEKYGTSRIWKYLIAKHQTNFLEEWGEIDISDLTELALQVNDENIWDYEFVKQFCPEEPKLFFEVCKGLKYWILDQLCNQVLNRCLIEKCKKTWTEENNKLNISVIKKTLIISLIGCFCVEKWKENWNQWTNTVY